MKFRSTREPVETVGFCQALERGIAPDGGLYVPVRFPRFQISDFDAAETLGEVAEVLLAPFLAGSELHAALGDICREAFSFPTPLRLVESNGHRLFVLELFHGPTAAFKDVGARFLAACFQRLNQEDPRPLTILVATSGDTGGAVAAAFHGRSGTRVIVLFPRGLVSARQEKQLTCWGGNVESLRVAGTFDDCQGMVKQAFADPGLRKRSRLSSANSINLGRLLPQSAYYAASSLSHWREHGQALNFVVPTGNLGNGVACVWARAMGLPIGQIVFATNANRPIPKYLATGRWQPGPSVATLASAMDVGNPSNMERLRDLLPDLESVRAAVSAYAIDDEAIRDQITRDFRRRGEIWCPHTATAARVFDQLAPAQQAGSWALVATAHPAKFETIVEPLIGQAVPVPASLAGLLDLPSQVQDVAADLDSLRHVIEEK
jgi:threonine synthase